MNTPKVSIIVPNYNHARYLPTRLASIFAQTFQDFEVIILDDASTDNSRQLLTSFASDERVRLYFNQANSGSPFKQWNKGVRYARGDYIWMAESDDFASAELLTALVDQLERDPNIGLAYCQSTWVDEKNHQVGSAVQYYMNLPDKERWLSDFQNHGYDECLTYLARLNTIPNASAVLFRREAYEQTGGANETLTVSGDWLLWLSILQEWDLAFVARPLNYFRIHPKSVREQSDKNGDFIREFYIIQAHIARHFSIDSTASNIIFNSIASYWFSLGANGVLSSEIIASIYTTGKQVDARLPCRLAKIACKHPGRVILGREKLNVSFAGAMFRLWIKSLCSGFTAWPGEQ